LLPVVDDSGRLRIPHGRTEETAGRGVTPPTTAPLDPTGRCTLCTTSANGLELVSTMTVVTRDEIPGVLVDIRLSIDNRAFRRAVAPSPSRRESVANAEPPGSRLDTRLGSAP
jgi:hypothetical protein